VKTLIAGAILACLLLALTASAQITPVRTVGGIGVRSFEHLQAWPNCRASAAQCRGRRSHRSYERGRWGHATVAGDEVGTQVSPPAHNHAQIK
jgi:hypothetical protein